MRVHRNGKPATNNLVLTEEHIPRIRYYRDEPVLQVARRVHMYFHDMVSVGTFVGEEVKSWSIIRDAGSEV